MSNEDMGKITTSLSNDAEKKLRERAKRKVSAEVNRVN